MKKKSIITISIIVCILIVSLATNSFLYKEQICVNGTVYTQRGDSIMELPTASVELGYLTSISHRSTHSPFRDFTGINLDEKYAGCPIYQNGEIIYLEDFGGFYIPFLPTN